MAISGENILEVLVMVYYVYMMTNKHHNVLYTGFTNDLLRRVYTHKEHLLSDSFTARYHVDQLVYFETTNDVRVAIEREKQIKSWNRKRKNELVESINPQWRDLYPDISREQLNFDSPEIATPVCALARNDTDCNVLRRIYANRKS